VFQWIHFVEWAFNRLGGNPIKHIAKWVNGSWQQVGDSLGGISNLTIEEFYKLTNNSKNAA